NLPEGAGKFTRALPLAVVLTVLASLLIALTIVPFLASRFLPREEHPEGNRVLRWLQRGIRRAYAPLVRRALERPRTALALAFALFLASLALVPVLGFALFPPADKPQFIVSIEAAEGASLESTDRALRFVEDELGRHPEVRHVMANLGKGNPYIYYNLFPREERSSTAEVFVGLARWEGARSEALLGALRARFDTFPGARIVVKRFENGPPIEAPLAVRVIGPDLAVLRELSLTVERAVAATAGVRDVANPLRLPRIDIDLGIDTAKAGLLGVSSVDLERSVRAAVSGYPASTFRDTLGDEYPVMLRLPIDDRATLSLLGDVRITSRSSGQAVPLAQLANPHLVSGPDRIERRDRERLVTVTAYVSDGHVMSEVTQAVFAAVSALPLPPGYRVEAGGEAEAASSSLGGLGAAV
ncbi:MAG: efflux RND transporter permease subunit, partial [Gammaproteobacteria bacterium]